MFSRCGVGLRDLLLFWPGSTSETMEVRSHSWPAIYTPLFYYYLKP
ncbi:hypothetical protein LCGC14_0674080 [marine sediment metagenome]|uniref:Uncharacterized protein n=1 Tax=marine sediment metagenome TaxID=412755 RepID=A0A0F9TBL0_9ZZZZ